jgi:uncharacterized protein
VEPVQVIRPDLVLVDWGPMSLSISAWAEGRPRPVMAAQAARQALACLAVLADFQGYMSTRVKYLPAGRPLPTVVHSATRACRAVDRELTPLAAVAGAVAGAVAELAVSLGADKVVVNNGGDIAIYLGRNQGLRLGLRPPSETGQPQPLLGRLDLSAADCIGGVASSGWQGRSLSAGAADLVTVWAKDAALADAAATALGNAVAVRSPALSRKPAQTLDPACGLGNQKMTVSVGPLSAEQRQAALAAGMAAARRLHAAGLIKGCVLLLQGDLALLDPGRILSLASSGPMRPSLAA